VRVLINALSVTNLSGRAVLLGHLAPLARWTEGRHDFVVLFHRANRDLCRDLGPNVGWLECPAATARWQVRAVWERRGLVRLAREQRADVLMMFSGTAAGRLPLPQVVFAMNPWCFVRRAQYGPRQRLKARLQRWAYRRAVERADLMVYLSDYLRREYRANAGGKWGNDEVAHAPLAEDVRRAAREIEVERRPGRILCVSAMLPHKGVETVLGALTRLRARGIPTDLVLVGGWPDPRYERSIRRLIRREGLERHVRVEGYVERDALFRHYAGARVFCLMSWCESFGIPALEAQAFGTPVVSSDCCAIPEVCGAGGLFPPPDDVAGTARALERLLTDETCWRESAARARANAEGFTPERCTRPLLRMFSLGREACSE